MGLTGLLDSNVIIDFFGDNLPEASNQYLYSGNFAASHISLIEVLGFPMDMEIEKQFQAFFDSIQLLPIEIEVIELAIQLRKSKKIKLGDSIVAATCMKHNIPLITRNVSDFKTIPRIEVINSFQIS